MTGRSHGYGGRRIGRADRERIISAYLNEGRSAADAIAVGELGLDEWYAYKVVHERGLLPQMHGRRHAADMQTAP